MKIQEVFQYAVTHYDRATEEGGLFVEYTNKFLKLKTETSDFPSCVLTPSDEDHYIEEFWQSEGIRLDKDSIGYNASKRRLAKLCLNSL